MKYDIILTGVGGQGVLSVAAIISLGAMIDGLNVKQSEVHGMAQRGGTVISHLRISDQPIESDLIAKGSADLLLSMEPLESLRYLENLKENGVLITSKNPVINIPDYPDLDNIINQIKLLPKSRVIDSDFLARKAGSTKSVNMVIVGAAAGELPIQISSLQSAISELFSKKGEKVIQINYCAFELGQNVID